MGEMTKEQAQEILARRGRGAGSHPALEGLTKDERQLVTARSTAKARQRIVDENKEKYRELYQGNLWEEADRIRGAKKALKGD